MRMQINELGIVGGDEVEPHSIPEQVLKCINVYRLMIKLEKKLYDQILIKVDFPISGFSTIQRDRLPLLWCCSCH